MLLLQLGGKEPHKCSEEEKDQIEHAENRKENLQYNKQQNLLR